MCMLIIVYKIYCKINDLSNAMTHLNAILPLELIAVLETINFKDNNYKIIVNF